MESSDPKDNSTEDKKKNSQPSSPVQKNRNYRPKSRYHSQRKHPNSGNGSSSNSSQYSNQQKNPNIKDEMPKEKNQSMVSRKHRSHYKPQPVKKEDVSNKKKDSEQPQHSNTTKNNTPYNNRSNSRRRRRTKSSPNRFPKEPVTYEICPLCEKPIRDPHTAILEKESQKKAHFDCIINLLKQQLLLEENEKIYYLGGGSFGIIRERKTKNRLNFFIRKRIQYEERDKSKSSSTKENDDAENTPET